jgi:sugar lactone lactonase YvrE
MTRRIAATVRLLTLLPFALLIACGGGGGSAPASPPPPPPPALYTIGGTLSGLSANASLTLSNNGGDSLTLTADGAFQFATGLASNAAYSVAITTAPGGEKCGLLNATGMVAGNVSNVMVACAVPELQLVAGGLGGSGNADGPATGARFYYPLDVGYDAAGNWYISDAYNKTVRKVDLSLNVTTLAGSPGQQGTTDGTGPAARFSNPSGLAVDLSGIVYLVDAGVNTIRRIDTTGVVTTLAGTPNVSGTNDGTGPAAQFENPQGIRLDASGMLYLSDNNRIRKITPQGVVTTVFTGAAQLVGLALDGSGHAYVANLGAKSLDVVNLAAGTSSALAGGLNGPVGVALAPTGTLSAGTTYVSNGAYSATIQSVASDGTVSPFAGSTTAYGNVDGQGAAALLWNPIFMVAEPTGTVLFADAGDSEIRQFTPDATVTTRVGLGAHPGNINGTGPEARFDNPEALAADTSGNLYLSDSYGLRKVTPAGVVSAAFSGGGGSTGLAIDAAGNAYFSQSGFNSIYKVSGTNAPVLFAGSGSALQPGSADGTGNAAGFTGPNGIAIDAAGNLFVADTGNYTIRKITPAGVVTTLAGSASVRGTTDGSGSAALFWAPFGIAVDGKDVLYVTDGNAIRKVAADGTVTTLAGSVQTAGYADGTGSAALFNSPDGIAIGPAGSLMVADNNHVIRQVSAAGVVITVVGTAGKAGVNPAPLPTTLNVPVGLVYVWPTLYLIDAQENSILSVSGIF